MPDMIERLGIEHVPDQDSRCRACTVPGHGTPGHRWPCAPAALAADASRARSGGAIRYRHEIELLAPARPATPR